MAELRIRISYNGDRRNTSFPFALLPYEVKEMILERVIDETADFDEFKKFWRLKRVNKEFYSILTSNYAKRHFLKYPCCLVFDGIQIYPGTDDERTSDAVHMTVYWPPTPCRPWRPFRIWRLRSSRNISDGKKIVYNDVRRGRSYFIKRCHSFSWKDVPGYLRDKPFRIDLVQIVPFVSTVHMIPVILKLSNQASESLCVTFRAVVENGRVDDSSSDYHHSFTHSVQARFLFLSIISKGLQGASDSGKICFDYED